MPMEVEVLAVPYDAGHEDLRVGRGPARLLEGGLTDLLRGLGHKPVVRWVRATQAFRAEIRTTFDLCRGLAGQVRSAAGGGRFPLVLSGNCFTALGALSGLGPSPLGLVWFDSHGEYNTPETTASGWLDGMGLAAATGDCWRTLTARISGFEPMPEERIVLVGGHDFDPEEHSRLTRSRLVLVPPGDVTALGPALDRLEAQVERVYLHLDLDVLDAAEARANDLAVPGGMNVQAVAEAIGLVRRRFEIAGAGIAGYDPAFDPDGSTLDAVRRLVTSLLEGHPLPQP
jgi:arginase